MPRFGNWTEERTDKLKKLWHAGFSFSQIAAELGGLTRSAVCGKVSRLELPSPLSKREVFKTPRKPYGRGPSALAVANRLQRDRDRSKKRRSAEQKENQQIILGNGATKTSSVYRKQLPHLPEMTKGELRAMLTTAVQNTAAMELA